MDIVTIGPFLSGSLRWRTRSGDYVETLVCKATFTLHPTTCLLADEQEAVIEADDHWNDDASRSLHVASDLVPYKHRADVVLIGDAFAPRGEPVRSAIVRLVVGELDKSIEVFCDRTFTRDGEILEGAHWRRFPLRYERSAGGSGTTNPVGIRRDGTDAMGRRMIPNLQPPGEFVQHLTDVTTPIGFGPIAPDWPERSARLGRHKGTWPTRAWNQHPIPEGVEPDFFNVAPRDQQVDVLRSNERLVLENLHPEHVRLVTSLPGISPNVRVARGGSGAQVIEPRADTLVIDSSRGICTMTWRAQITLTSPQEEVAVVVTLRQTNAPASEDGDQVITSVLGVVGRDGSTLPFTKGPAVIDSTPNTLVLAVDPDLSKGNTLADFGAKPTRAALPFRSDEPRVAPAPQPPTPATSRQARAPTAAPAIPKHAPSAPHVPRVATPDYVPLPTTPTSTSSEKRSPWATGSDGRSSGPTIGESAAALGVASTTPSAPKVTAESDVRTSAPARRAEGVTLLWHEPSCVKRLRRDKAFRRIMTELDLTPPVDPVEAALEEEDEADVQDKRRVHEVLARAEAQSSAGLRRLFDETREKGGRIEPALVLVAGDLEMPFDEVEALRATVTAVTPFVGGDKKLKEALDTATELLKTPWLEGSGGLAASLLERLRDAFAQARHGLPPDHLEAHTERALLQQRRYQRRSLYGKPSLRGLLQLPDTDRLPASLVPTYLPESIADRLPIFRRIAVRALVDMGEREDQYEVCPMALRVVALARVLSK